MTAELRNEEELDVAASGLERNLSLDKEAALSMAARLDVAASGLERNFLTYQSILQTLMLQRCNEEKKDKFVRRQNHRGNLGQTKQPPRSANMPDAVWLAKRQPLRRSAEESELRSCRKSVPSVWSSQGKAATVIAILMDQPLFLMEVTSIMSLAAALLCLLGASGLTSEPAPLTRALSPLH